MTGEDHTVRVGFEEYTYTFDSENETFEESDDVQTITAGVRYLKVSATDSTEELIYGEDYICENRVLTVLSEKGITIKNSGDVIRTSDTIFVAKDVSANITLSGVRIDTAKVNGSSAFKIADDSTGDVTVILENYNFLKSADGYAAVQKNGKNGTLTIKGEGNLKAIGGSNAAAIGCGENSYCKNITICGATVTAKGGTNAAAIGGGNNSSAENIVISGGSVKAVKGENAPNEIGGGLNKAAVVPTDANGKNVYLLTLANAEGKELVIDGKAYKPNTHKTLDESLSAVETDENLYVYLTGEHHIVKSGKNTVHYIFENGSLKEAPFEYEHTKSKHWKIYSCCADIKVNEEAHKIVKGKCETCTYEEVYTVTYTDGKNGEFFEEESYTAKYGDKMPSLKADVSGIKGWKLNGWDKTVSKTVTGNVTYTAKWSSKGANTLRHNGNGGKTANGYTVSDNYTNAASISVKANSFEKTGYYFNAWNTEADASGDWYRKGETVNFGAEHNAEIFNLYAIWTANYYTVSFNANGGEGAMQDISARYDSGFSLTENSFSKEGCKFVGWNTQADGTGKSFTDKEDVINLTSLNNETVTLYAQWQDKNAPVISGVEDGKTYCSSQTVTVTDEDIDFVTVNGDKIDLDENGQFVIEPSEDALVIKATDKSGNATEITVKVNDGHTYEDGACTVCGEENTDECYFIRLLRSAYGFIVDVLRAIVTFIKSIFTF